MKAVEFETMTIQEEPIVDPAWRAAGRRRFEEAYCAEDAVYEQSIDDAQAANPAVP
jgi:hypothetical protein